MNTEDIEFYKPRVKLLQKHFPSLTEFEAIQILQREAISDNIDRFVQDFRAANVVSNLPDAPAPALEKIAMILMERLAPQ